MCFNWNCPTFILNCLHLTQYFYEIFYFVELHSLFWKLVKEPVITICQVLGQLILSLQICSCCVFWPATGPTQQSVACHCTVPVASWNQPWFLYEIDLFVFTSFVLTSLDSMGLFYTKQAPVQYLILNGNGYHCLELWKKKLTLHDCTWHIR